MSGGQIAAEDSQPRGGAFRRSSVRCRLPPTSAATERVTTAAKVKQPTINSRRIERRHPMPRPTPDRRRSAPTPPPDRPLGPATPPARVRRAPSQRGGPRPPGDRQDGSAEASATGGSRGLRRSSRGVRRELPVRVLPAPTEGRAGRLPVGSAAWCMSRRCSPQKSDGLGTSWKRARRLGRSRARAADAGSRSSARPSHPQRRTTFLSDGVPFPTCLGFLVRPYPTFSRPSAPCSTMASSAGGSISQLNWFQFVSIGEVEWLSAAESARIVPDRRGGRGRAEAQPADGAQLDRSGLAACRARRPAGADQAVGLRPHP